MKRIFTHLFVAVLLMLSTTSWAQSSPGFQFEEGHVYRFVNRNTGRSLNACGDYLVNAATSDETSLKQQWYVTKEGDYYVLRNLFYARYLKGAHVNKVVWSLTDDYSSDANKFTYVKSDTEYNSLETKGWTSYGFMHDDGNTYNGGTRVVSWDNENTSKSSHWTTYEVEYTANELQAILNERPTAAEAVAKVSENFISLFNETACYTPKYSSLAEAQATAAYQALTDEMQQLVDKIYNKTYGDGWAEATVAPADRPNGNNNTNHNLWTVADTWDSDYAKKFRVQMYEPYSIESEVTSYLRTNAHCNMDNPTGIYANSGEVIYIMVDGDIPEGAELWLAHQSGNGATQYYNNSAYTQLHQGLNRVTFTTDGCQMWINYVVHTYNANGADIDEKFPEDRKLSKYKPLKIHIEGGHINGFFNALGDFRATTDAENLWGDVDNDEDWNYYKARVALPTDFALLGHRQTLLFPFGTYNSDKKHFGVTNADGGIEHALAYHLDSIKVPTVPNCYGGSGNTFGTFDGSYSGMNLDASNGKINIMMEAWDRITYSELASMGLVSTSTMDKMNTLYPRWTKENTPAEIYNYGSATVNNVTQSYKEFCQGIDYSEYFNHHACGVGAGSGYMSGGWRVCNYHYNTMGSIIGAIAAEAGPTWGPAHEIGHQNQGVFNLNGQTEITNNFFSQIAAWYMGMATSRVNGSSGSVETLLNLYNNKDANQYLKLTEGDNIWALVQMYYKLWLYYHLAGNNTQFWPRLFELCRREPLENGGQIDGSTTLLRFYKYACNVAGEDLTEFFRAHGYLDVMDNIFVEDYSSAIYNQTQEQIDAAIAEIKEKKYPVNYAILLINDGTSEAAKKHDGSTSRSLWDNNPTAEFGSVNDFISGNLAKTPYTATLNSDGTITMSGGQGGVGFLILNDKGEIVSFSNKSTFALGEEAKHALVSGAATVVSVSSDNSEPVEATIDLSVVKKEILASLIDEVRAVVAGVDDTYTKVGCYKPSAVTDLQAAIEVAEGAYANGTAYEGAYEVLYAEYRKVIDNPVSVIGVISGKKYAIKSRSGNDYMTVSGTNVVTTGNSTLPTTDANLWIIETAGENYHIKHAGTGKYLQGVSDDNSVRYTVGSTAVDYKMTRIENSYYALSTAEHSTRYMNRHAADNIATWNSTDANSQWTITLADVATADAGNLANLELLVNKTRELLDKVADVEYTGEGYPLQAEDRSANFYITSNATEGGHEPKYLLDNSTSTFFHTVWAGGSPGEAHYLQVDMGAENAIGEFVLSYTTIGQTNVDAPKTIEVKGSNSENSGFQTIATLSSLPTTHVTPYTSGVLGNDNTKYRYLRFTVTDATGGQLGGYYYFGISEFVIKRMNYQLNGIHSDYPDATNEIVTAAIEKYEAAKLAIANGSGYADALSQLQTAYDALYDASLTVLNAKKAELQELINATKILLNTAGSITTTENGELALQVTDASGNYYLSTNSQEKAANRNISKLVDGVTDNSDSYFHTDWQTSVGADHHLLLDMGADKTLGEFTFKYTTRNNNAGIDAPKTIVVEGSNDNSGFTQIAELTGLPTGQHQTYTSAVLGDKATGYRYIRFRVTDGAGKVGNYYYFAMSEFDVTAIGSTTVTVKDEYKANVTEELFVATNDKVVASEMLMNNTTSVELLEAQIVELTAAKAALEEAMTKVTIDKTALQSLYNLALPLYNEMADENGAIKADYTPSDLTVDMLAAAKTALDAAKDKLDNSNSQSEIDGAEGALQTAYDALLAIKDANLDEDGRADLNDCIVRVKSYLGEIASERDGEYYLNAYYAVLNEQPDFGRLCNELKRAQELYKRFYLTQQQCADEYAELTMRLTNVMLAVNADCTDRAGLTELIGNVNTLLSTIAVAGETTVALPLQAANAGEAFYIWCNAPAGDSDGVAGLIDKNADGTANTRTFLGTNWGADVPAYTHYIEIDLGVAGTIDQLTMDYTTRNSTHADQRPNAIKILGSNDKENYTPVTEITEGLATGQTEKWTMATPLALGAHYRYIRIAVGSDRGYFHMSDFNLYATLSHTLKEYYTTAEGLDLTTLCLALDEAQDAAACYMTEEQYNTVSGNLNTIYTNAKGIVEADYTDRDALSSLIATTGELIESVEGYEYLSEEVITSANNAKSEAAVAVDADRYVSKDDYDAALAELQQAYNALLSAVKKPLKELIDETVLLKNSLYEISVVSYNATEVTLNVTEGEAGYLYCNAPGDNNEWGDGQGVAALLDKNDDGSDNTGTYMHTPYNTDLDDNADGLDHYLRVDLGEGGAAYVKFDYVGRTDYPALTPSTIVVEACNDLEKGEWIEIEILTGLESTTDKVASGCLGNGGAYRYWRFMVTATNDGRECNGHPYFALSDFNVYKCTDVVLDTQLKSEYTPNIYIYKTNTLVAEVGTAISAATAVYDDAAATAADCDNAIAALQPVKDKLAQAIEYYWCPVQLTTDATAPALYTIDAPGRSDVNNSKAWQYNAQNNNITIVNKDTANLYHLWYFMLGGKEHTVKIVPVMTPGHSLTATDFGNGAGKVSAVAENSVDWSFANAGSNWNFKPFDRDTYLSHYGGGGNALGFYGSADGGSYVSFTAVGVENYAFARLAELSKAHAETIITGTTFGCYVQETGDVYNEALTAAAELVASASAGDDEYVAAFTNLYNATSGLEIVLPEDGTVLCTITNVGREGGKMFAGGETKPVLCWDNNAVNAKYIFTFEPTGEKGKFYMKSLERGTYISTNLGHGGGAENIAADRDTAIVVTIANMSCSSRAVSITPVGGAMLHADASGNANKVVAWNNNEADGASAWLIDEVTDLSQVTHTVTMNATFSSVMLGYNATVPAGVEAYNAEGVEDGYVSLVEVAKEGEVIPANTPVILYRTDDETSKTFTYTPNPATSVPKETVLGGSLYQKFVKCDDKKNYYKLMIKEGVAKMYWMYKEFNAEGNYGENDVLKGTDNGGHIKCSANKIYMALPIAQDAASYGMRFVGGESTDILDFTGEQREDVIYDLQGRKLTEITHPGFYMINGKKVYVK